MSNPNSEFACQVLLENKRAHLLPRMMDIFEAWAEGGSVAAANGMKVKQRSCRESRLLLGV